MNEGKKHMELSHHQKDRALGVIIASAAGDALGAPYEFEPPIAESAPVELRAGGGWQLGEYTDDTGMAYVILRQMAQGNSLSDQATLDQIVADWVEWSETARDVGIQTRNVLSALATPSANEALEAARELHETRGKSGGNGSLMRTGPVAIATLHSEEQTVANARVISKLTHFDDDAGDACILWCLAIRHAVLTGELDIRVGLPHVRPSAHDYWVNLIEEAESSIPADFSHNGWVIHAFQAAWAAICQAERILSEELEFESDRLRLALEFAVRAGYDTDTVAAIAGSLVGAKYGLTAVPSVWRLKLHGWPGITQQQLVEATYLALNDGETYDSGWPIADKFHYSANYDDRAWLVQHPDDAGLWLGGVDSLANLPDSVTAVVSLCRIGKSEVPFRIKEKLEVLLIDSRKMTSNLDLEFVFANTADAIAKLRKEGQQVFLHCVQSQSRTPAVAISYGMRALGQSLDKAHASVREVLPNAYPNETFMRTLEAMSKKREKK
jgi:ADP-ribosylglycohydrolase